MRAPRIPWLRAGCTRSLLAILMALALAGCQLASPASGSILFQDDFSDVESGWQRGADIAGSADYIAGGFRLTVALARTGKISTPGLHFKDVRIEADVTRLAGPENNNYGLLCRYQDAANFYFFQISSDGYYGIGKYKGGKMALIGTDKMQSSDRIRQGQAINHLRADCVQDRLSLWVNGFLIAEVKDGDFIEGDTGIIAGTFEVPGTDIYFDNFMVMQP